MNKTYIEKLKQSIVPENIFKGISICSFVAAKDKLCSHCICPDLVIMNTNTVEDIESKLSNQDYHNFQYVLTINNEITILGIPGLISDYIPDNTIMFVNQEMASEGNTRAVAVVVW